MSHRRVLGVLAIGAGIVGVVLLLVQDLTRGYVDTGFTGWGDAAWLIAFGVCVVFAFAAACTDTEL